MSSVVLVILSSKLLLYSAGSGVNRLQLILSGFINFFTRKIFIKKIHPKKYNIVITVVLQ